MKFHVCCCFFDYYLHIPSTQTIFTVKKSANKDKNYGFTVVLSSDNEIFQPFTSVHTMPFWFKYLMLLR